MVTEAIDLTGYDDWQLELLDKLRIKMLRFAGPASMFFALAMTQEEIPSELHGYLDSLAAEVLPYFCNEASPTNGLPGPFYNLKPVLYHNTFSEIKKLQLEADALRAATQESNDLKAMSTKPIFISHASKDREIVDVFVDEYLERGLKLDAHTQVYYTSSQVTGIAAGSDWRESIRKSLIDSDIVFCFISEHYSQSQYCIAELGAAWAFQKTIIPIQIPPRQVVSGGELYSVIQMIKGSDRLALGRLRDDLVDTHKVGERIASSPKWDKALSKFVDAVIAAEGKK
jgi:hypothetical protein